MPPHQQLACGCRIGWHHNNKYICRGRICWFDSGNSFVGVVSVGTASATCILRLDWLASYVYQTRIGVGLAATVHYHAPHRGQGMSHSNEQQPHCIRVLHHRRFVHGLQTQAQIRQRGSWCIGLNRVLWCCQQGVANVQQGDCSQLQGS